MSEHIHFDGKKIEAANAAYCARLAESLQKAGGEGAEARLKNDLMPSFFKRFAQEINDGTSAEDISAATASFLAHVVLTLSMSFNSKGGVENKAGLANYILLLTSEFVADGLTVEQPFTSIAPEQSGRA